MTIDFFVWWFDKRDGGERARSFVLLIGKKYLPLLVDERCWLWQIVNRTITFNSWLARRDLLDSSDIYFCDSLENIRHNVLFQYFTNNV